MEHEGLAELVHAIQHTDDLLSNIKARGEYVYLLITGIWWRRAVRLRGPGASLVTIEKQLQKCLNEGVAVYDRIKKHFSFARSIGCRNGHVLLCNLTRKTLDLSTLMKSINRKHERYKDIIRETKKGNIKLIPQDPEDS